MHVELSPLALRTDELRRVRQVLSRLREDDPRRPEAIEDLAGTLLALAALHRDAAVAEDAKAAVLPPPRDLEVRPVEDERAELDMAEEEEAFVLQRDEEALSALSPRSRAHVLEADRCLVEASALLRGLLADPPHARERARLHARLARTLDVLGQHTAARKEWLAVVRTEDDAEPGAQMEAWLAFATWFVEVRRSPEDIARAAGKVEAAARRVDERGRARVCSRFANARSVVPSLCP
jgi:hypothetical protein